MCPFNHKYGLISNLWDNNCMVELYLVRVFLPDASLHLCNSPQYLNI